MNVCIYLLWNRQGILVRLALRLEVVSSPRARLLSSLASWASLLSLQHRLHLSSPLSLSHLYDYSQRCPTSHIGSQCDSKQYQPDTRTLRQRHNYIANKCDKSPCHYRSHLSCTRNCTRPMRCLLTITNVKKHLSAHRFKRVSLNLPDK